MGTRIAESTERKSSAMFDRFANSDAPANRTGGRNARTTARTRIAGRSDGAAPPVGGFVGAIVPGGARSVGRKASVMVPRRNRADGLNRTRRSIRSGCVAANKKLGWGRDPTRPHVDPHFVEQGDHVPSPHSRQGALRSLPSRLTAPVPHASNQMPRLNDANPSKNSERGLLPHEIDREERGLGHQNRDGACSHDLVCDRTQRRGREPRGAHGRTVLEPSAPGKGGTSSA